MVELVHESRYLIHYIHHFFDYTPVDTCPSTQEVVGSRKLANSHHTMDQDRMMNFLGQFSLILLPPAYPFL